MEKTVWNPDGYFELIEYNVDGSPKTEIPSNKGKRNKENIKKTKHHSRITDIEISNNSSTNISNNVPFGLVEAKSVAHAEHVVIPQFKNLTPPYKNEQKVNVQAKKRQCENIVEKHDEKIEKKNYSYARKIKPLHLFLKFDTRKCCCRKCNLTISSHDFLEHLSNIHKEFFIEITKGCIKQQNNDFFCLLCGSKINARSINDFLYHFQFKCIYNPATPNILTCSICQKKINKNNFIKHFSNKHAFNRRNLCEKLKYTIPQVEWWNFEDKNNDKDIYKNTNKSKTQTHIKNNRSLQYDEEYSISYQQNPPHTYSEAAYGEKIENNNDISYAHYRENGKFGSSIIEDDYEK